MGAADPLVIGVLVPTLAGEPPPPTSTPLGRAAATLREEGVALLFGHTWAEDGALQGVFAQGDRWVPAQARPAALYDRAPMLGQAAAYAAAIRGAAGLRIGNPPALRALCQDKLACQQALDAAGVGGLPPVEDEPAAFAARLEEWGAAFLKPRFGSRGVGVRRVARGEPDPLPAALPGLRPGQDDPALLQFAVPPPAGDAGWSVRVLCQRAPTGRWITTPAVLRRSAVDPVVNAARGAVLEPAADRLSDPDHRFALGLALTACEVLGADPAALELGVDLVIDREGQAWIVEVNGRPDGRLTGLAAADPDRFGAAAAGAAARPLRRLAALCRAAQT